MTADKYSVLIKYSYLDIAKKNALSDEDFGMLMKGIIDYDKTGKEPKFKKQNLSIAFSFIKCDLDSNKKKWESRVIANQNNGKKGGRPPKTQRNPNNPLGFSENPNNPLGFLENPTKPKKPDSGSGGGNGYDLEFGSGGGSRPPPPVENIKKESGAWGFYIDTAVSVKIQNSGIDPAWLVGPHSFLEFCAASVKKRYPGKEDDKLKPIYISAVTSWDDLRQEYPSWRADQEKEARIKAANEAYENAKKNKPKICRCGGTLDGRLVCQSCKGSYFFDNENLQYKYDPLFEEDEAEKNDKLRRKLGKNSG